MHNVLYFCVGGFRFSDHVFVDGMMVVCMGLVEQETKEIWYLLEWAAALGILGFCLFLLQVNSVFLVITLVVFLLCMFSFFRIYVSTRNLLKYVLTKEEIRLYSLLEVVFVTSFVGLVVFAAAVFK